LALQPRWFSDALARTPEERAVEVVGTQVRYSRWGEPDRPGVVLVHGGAAHRRWWDFLAPFLLPAHHVVAPDLSGHGDSGRRRAYSMETWAQEVVAVAEDSGMTEPPVLVGHSMGGLVSVVAAAHRGHELAGAVVIDAPVRRADPESQEGRDGRAFRTPGVYEDLDTALRHFSLVPRQPLEHDFIRTYVARTSLHETARGWTWKFDPTVFSGPHPGGFSEQLAAVRCRVAVFHGEWSELITPDVQAYMNELLGRAAPFVEIPQAHHHLVLDQPLAFVAALRAILADWEHTVPRHPPVGLLATTGRTRP
jgi:pimeloyl-ACP methyl ester carboxylesterase